MRFYGLYVSSKIFFFHEGEQFSIQRGVKQGDVVSSILFTAALESTKWRGKLKLRHHGVEIGAHERSTNVRHADDLMLYAVSCQDLVYMIETRMMELARLNGSQHATLVTVATWRCVVRC